jgi:hypothetical protein
MRGLGVFAAGPLPGGSVEDGAGDPSVLFIGVFSESRTSRINVERADHESVTPP